MKSYTRTIVLFGAFAAGFLCPQAAGLKFLIRYMIALMMFFSLLKLRPVRRPLRREHAVIFSANLLLGLGGWGVFALAGNRVLAETAFFTGISPTATAAGIVTALLGGRQEFVISSFVLTNLGMALLLPGLIPLVTGLESSGIFLHVAADLAFVLGLPFLAAALCRRYLPEKAPLIVRSGDISFYLWGVTIFLIIANASNFLRTRAEGLKEAAAAALISLALCVLGFTLGRCIGGKRRPLECAQSLGQKNTTLTLFLAVVYASPAAALGPAFYVVWHNSWNALQLWKRTRRLEQRAAGRRDHV